jgi:hypothetical protein
MSEQRSDFIICKSEHCFGSPVSAVCVFGLQNTGNGLMSLFDVENVDCVEQCLDSAEISNLILVHRVECGG